MVRTCTVCKLTKDKFRALGQEGKFILHVFPLHCNEELLQKWLSFAELKKEDGLANKVICSEHFVEDDYNSYTSSNLDIKYELKRTAVPTVVKIKPPPSTPLKNIKTIFPLKPDERFIMETEITRLNQLHLRCFEKQSTIIEQLQIKNKDQDTEIKRLMKAHTTLEATLEEERRSNNFKINGMVLQIKSLNIKLEELRIMSRESMQSKK